MKHGEKKRMAALLLSATLAISSAVGVYADETVTPHDETTVTDNRKDSSDFGLVVTAGEAKADLSFTAQEGAECIVTRHEGTTTAGEGTPIVVTPGNARTVETQVTVETEEKIANPTYQMIAELTDAASLKKQEDASPNIAIENGYFKISGSTSDRAIYSTTPHPEAAGVSFKFKHDNSENAAGYEQIWLGDGTTAIKNTGVVLKISDKEVVVTSVQQNQWKTSETLQTGLNLKDWLDVSMSYSHTDGYEQVTLTLNMTDVDGKTYNYEYKVQPATSSGAVRGDFSLGYFVLRTASKGACYLDDLKFTNGQPEFNTTTVSTTKKLINYTYTDNNLKNDTDYTYEVGCSVNGKWVKSDPVIVHTPKVGGVTSSEPKPTETKPTDKELTDAINFKSIPYTVFKRFENKAMPATALGDTGLKIESPSTTAYTNVVVINEDSLETYKESYKEWSTKKTDVYYATKLKDPAEGKYLFLGTGSNTTMTMTLPKTVQKDSKITIKFAWPTATNDAGKDRTKATMGTMKVGGQTIDIGTVTDDKLSRERDKWITETVTLTEDASTIVFDLKAWGAVAIAGIKIDGKTEDPKPTETESTETKPTETKPTETKPTEVKPNYPAKGKPVTPKDGDKKATYTSNGNGTVTYTGTKSKGDIKIPDAITGTDGQKYNVTDIKASALKGNKNIKKVTIGANVVTIGKSAFEKSKITEVTIGKNVKTIGASAFANAADLKKITIKSEKLQKIEKKAFYNCKNKKLTKIVLPNSVKTIGDSAFEKCTSLKTVQIGKKSSKAQLTTIGKTAFKGDKNLANITIASKKLTKTSIKKNAFKGIKANVKFTVPKGTKKNYTDFFTKKTGLDKKKIKVTEKKKL